MTVEDEQQVESVTTPASTGTGIVIAAMWFYEAAVTVLLWLTWQIENVGVFFFCLVPLAVVWSFLGRELLRHTTKYLRSQGL